MTELDQQILILQLKNYADKFDETTYSADNGLAQSALNRILELQNVIYHEQERLTSAMALLDALGE